MKNEKEARVASDTELMRIDDAYYKKIADGLDWRKIAKLAANDLEAYSNVIILAAQTGQKRFFIDLGKCLSGDIKSGYDKLDYAIAVILSHNPSIKAKAAVRELKERGHPEISEENFRVRKQRLKALVRAVVERDKAHEPQIYEIIRRMVKGSA